MSVPGSSFLIDARFASPLVWGRMRIVNATQQGRRLAAVMFTDMVGYSALTRRDEAQALRLLDQHFRLVRSAIRPFRAREIKTIGDAFLIVFESAHAALDCGIAIQRQHASRNQSVPAAERFEIRIGIHLGDIEHRAGDVFGDGVNIASRVQPLAPHGGLAVSAHVHAQVHGKLAQSFRALGPQTLKNIPVPIEVFVLDAASLPAEPAAADARALTDRQRGWRWGVILGVAAAMIIGGAALRFQEPLRQRLQAVQSPPPTSPAQTIEARVGLLEAVDFALKEAPDATAYHVELEGGSYSVDLARGDKSVNLLIDADDGSVLEKLVEDESHAAEVRMSQVTLHDAVQAALKEAPGLVIEAEIMLLPGRAVIDVVVIRDGKRVPVEVDGKTGKATVLTILRQ